MADRLQYFYRQRVTEAELNLGFSLLEKADRNLAADLGIHGIVSGAVPTQHEPVADLTIDLSPPARAYDHLGRRIFFGSGQVVDCAVDLDGTPTAVPTPAEERWLGVFIRFDRLLSEPRTDGHSQEIFFRQEESFTIVVRQGLAAPSETAIRVPLEPDELLICDVLREHGQTQILNSHIDTSRRQAFVFAQGDAVAVVSGLWNILNPDMDTVQSALDAVDSELDDHFSGVAHAASAISADPHEYIAATSVQGQLQEIVTDLKATTEGDGATHVGNVAAAGSPYSLSAGTVRSQLAALLSNLNLHVHPETQEHLHVGGGELTGTVLLSALLPLIFNLPLSTWREFLQLGNDATSPTLQFLVNDENFPFMRLVTHEGDPTGWLEFQTLSLVAQASMQGTRPGRGVGNYETLPYAFASVQAGATPSLRKSFNLASSDPVLRMGVGKYVITPTASLPSDGQLMAVATGKSDWASPDPVIVTIASTSNEIVRLVVQRPDGTLVDRDFDVVIWGWD